MRQESAFNPRARSWVGALGLMQIYPPYAGKEVFKIVKHQDATPSDDFLYDPKNNIMMGATFLQILRDRYFADIKDCTVFLKWDRNCRISSS
jgi:membrane-bound lytic murein transglycosylase C